MKITVSQLRKIIKEEVQISKLRNIVREALAGGSVRKKSGRTVYDDAVKIIDILDLRATAEIESFMGVAEKARAGDRYNLGYFLSKTPWGYEQSHEEIEAAVDSILSDPYFRK